MEEQSLGTKSMMSRCCGEEWKSENTRDRYLANDRGYNAKNETDLSSHHEALSRNTKIHLEISTSRGIKICVSKTSRGVSYAAVSVRNSSGHRPFRPLCPQDLRPNVLADQIDYSYYPSILFSYAEHSSGDCHGLTW
jgi:hypothetical protein